MFVTDPKICENLKNAISLYSISKYLKTLHLIFDCSIMIIMAPKTQQMCFRNFILPVYGLVGSTLAEPIESRNHVSEVNHVTLINKSIILLHI
jgi:hypothetical protein